MASFQTRRRQKNSEDKMSELYLKLLKNHGFVVRVDDVKIESHPDSPRDQNILEIIDRTLKKSNATLDDIDNIEVEYSHGTFTSIKVAVSIANALAFAKDITVNNKKPPHLPQYPKEPNITYLKTPIT